MDTTPNTGDMPFIRTDFANGVARIEAVAAGEKPSVVGFLAPWPLFAGLAAHNLARDRAGSHKWTCTPVAIPSAFYANAPEPDRRQAAHN
jgi:hypothetical protein